jgi:hypothetical protein
VGQENFEFETSMAYIARPCLKDIEKQVTGHLRLDRDYPSARIPEE